MSKPTDVERKEMARKLRDYAGENVEWIAPWAVFHDWNGDNSVLLTNHLADLIDPVCELDLDISMENIKCSACSKAIPHGTNPLEMKYCPNCGARVVSCND
ncbi:hypothetical protein [uncultured Olegusella sp.]|uniref:hypothetical protein n=1 Tax=uncultured Olegusella sp. TaxID=1979846 RepID=UPI002621B242|nr:hypothetical protein [uncultured Olegusella sp.]